MSYFKTPYSKGGFFATAYNGFVGEAAGTALVEVVDDYLLIDEDISRVKGLSRTIQEQVTVRDWPFRDLTHLTHARPATSEAVGIQGPVVRTRARSNPTVSPVPVKPPGITDPTKRDQDAAL